ncbi:exodeoxyribonuclease VII large subunit, partial [Klebsiella pneumoniae]|uniref:exodeoxyribonuclease VII large subunit n=1 Tax=Klebsiella pneumoniae TaxID=573 RepID=UPI00272F2E68
ASEGCKENAAVTARVASGKIAVNSGCSVTVDEEKGSKTTQSDGLGLDREVLTVSQLNGRARVLLEDVFTNIWVEGEISNLARPASGHVY